MTEGKLVVLYVINKRRVNWSNKGKGKCSKRFSIFFCGCKQSKFVHIVLIVDKGRKNYTDLVLKKG